MNTLPRALFILRLREDYSTDLVNFKYPSVASGMYNSANFVSEMLISSGFESKVVTVVDNNGIDKEVHDFKPTYVFIEGYWVVPEKFDVLKKLHPSVKWVVRCHSEMPFLSQEGIAMEWTFGYVNRGVMVAANSPRMNHEFRTILGSLLGSKTDFFTPLLSNYYPTTNFTTREVFVEGEYIDICCFGALRPMKNQLIQATAAIEFAKKHGKKLRFHINAGRIESLGEGSIKNIKSLFANLPEHKLVNHEWTSHEEFVNLMKTMDFSMQVSFTESFNIVTADALSVGTPVVTSSEVPFVYPIYAMPTSTSSMVKAMDTIWCLRKEFVKSSTHRLKKYNESSQDLWVSFMNSAEIEDEEMEEILETLLAPPVWKLPFYQLWLEAKSWFNKL